MNDSHVAYSAETQSIGLESVGNARELGGYKTTDGHVVRHGVLLRTAAPDAASESDRRRLEHDLRLTRVLDLRMNMERQFLVDDVRGLDFAQTYRVPIMDEDYYLRLYAEISEEQLKQMSPLQMIVMGIDMGLVNDQMYVGFLEAETGKRGFAEVFSHLLAQPEGEALLFHCTQGKDRTGLVAMLALTALGVDEETIVFDYLLTNTFNAKLIEREQQGLLALGIPAEEIDKYMIGLDRVFPQTMQNALEHLRREYGSVWGYITKELGVGEAERRELRAKYLES